MDSKLERIARRMASQTESSSYGDGLDDFLSRLSDANGMLEGIQQGTPSPEGKVILTGMHSDLFNLISEFRKWIDRLKFMARAKSQKAA